MADEVVDGRVEPRADVLACGYGVADGGGADGVEGSGGEENRRPTPNPSREGGGGVGCSAVANR